MKLPIVEIFEHIWTHLKGFKMKKHLDELQGAFKALKDELSLI